MITLALFRKMAEDGVAGLVKDKDFFWEDAPLLKEGKPVSGVWMVTRGGTIDSPKKLNLKTTVDFYVAYKDKVKVEVVHRQILDWLRANNPICKLSGSVDGTTYAYSYSNVRLWPTTTPQNEGVTGNDLIVKMASVQLVYDDDN